MTDLNKIINGLGSRGGNALVLVGALALTACGDTANDSEATTDVAARAGGTALDELCLSFGPQTPRDISSIIGTNPVQFRMAPPADEMNLCNIHTNTNAEHKGPGSTFSSTTVAATHAMGRRI